VIRRFVPLLLAALALAGCGGEAGGGGEATLWVTQDRGAKSLVDTKVDAGQTVLRALRSAAKVETRFGGRFVQAIDGVDGDAGAQRDWFFFVNGIEADRSAAEVRVRPGDIVWWDFRDWGDSPRTPVVVGAFPEPFLHGWNGDVRPVAVRYAPGLEAGARQVGDRLSADSVEPEATAAPADANVFRLVGGVPRFAAAERSPGSSAGSPVVFTFAGDVDALLEGTLGRKAYSLP